MPSSSAAGHDDSDSQMSTKSGSSEEEPESAISNSGRGRTEEAKTWGQMFRIWPYHSFLIVIMEFSMMLTALNNVFNLYYINVLQFSPETTVILLNINGIIGGFTRLFGSAISDSYLGKFRAIFFGSCIFIVGKLIMTTATFLPPGPPHPYMDFAAVFIIMVGTSAMGPSIAPFAGDQFEPHQEKMISLFYSIFYASINIGAMISNIMMPVLRARPCFGKDSCYPLSFGVSTLGVITAFIIFVVGSKRYVRRPPKGNIFTAVYHVIKTARHNKAKSGKKAASTKDHWLDFYFDTHSCEQDPKCQELQKKEGDPGLCQKEQFVEDLRCLLRLLVVFIPMPMFWALYDQQYTVWMNQALMLDCRIWGNFRLLPDQMQVVNPVLIIVLIFLFQSFIYPMVERFVVLTPLRKMVAGGLIASLAFLVSGAVQLMINPTLPDTPPSGQAFVSVVNTFQNCSLEIRDGHGVRRQLFPNSSLINDKMAGRNELFHVDLSPPSTRWTFHGQGSDCPKKTMMMNGNGTAAASQLLELTFEVLSPVNFLSIGPAGAFLTAADSDKPTGGAGQFKIGVVLAFDNGGAKNGTNGLAFCRVGTECDHHAGKDFYVFTSKTGSHHNATEHVPFVWGEGEATVYPFIEVRPGRWKLYHLYNEPEQSMPKAELLVEPVGGQGVEFEMQEQGGIYALILTGSRAAPRVTVHQVVPHNGVSILWQLPQIFIISVAEILVSITGLEFAYSQSGPSMKAIASACWGLTVSLGSIIIIIVTLLPIENLATKAFLCAGAMLLDVLLFAFLAKYCYQYRRGTSAASSAMLVSSSTAGLKPPNMQKASLATTMTETTAKSGDVGGLAERKNINAAGK